MAEEKEMVEARMQVLMEHVLHIPKEHIFECFKDAEIDIAQINMRFHWIIVGITLLALAVSAIVTSLFLLPILGPNDQIPGAMLVVTVGLAVALIAAMCASPLIDSHKENLVATRHPDYVAIKSLMKSFK